MRLVAFAIAVAAHASLAGCIEPELVQCAGDITCPRGSMCDELHGTCVTQEQLAQCVDQAFGTPCETPGLVGACFDNVCLPRGCGNKVVEPADGEMCDDGNVRDGDGCSNDCRSDERCGNGVRDPGEACEDGNLVSRDGCDSRCLVETVAWDSTPVTPFISDTAVYDRARERLVALTYDGVWELVDGRWTIIPATSPHEIPGSPVAHYDSSRGQVVTVAGDFLDNGNYELFLLGWTGTAWDTVSQGVHAEGYLCGSVHDSMRNRTIVVTGGYGNMQTWSVSAAGAWTQLARIPEYIANCPMEVDPANGDIVLLGENNSQRPWKLAGTTWSATTMPSATPSYDAMTVFQNELHALEPRTGRIFVRRGGAWVERAGLRLPTTAVTTSPQSTAGFYVGANDTLVVTTGDRTWARTGGAWQLTRLPGAGSAIVPALPGLWLVGTETTESMTPLATWRVDGDAMIEAPLPTAPEGRYSMPCVLDLGRGGAICHGGFRNNPNVSLDDTFVLSANGWEMLAVPAYADRLQLLAYDPEARRTLFTSATDLVALPDDTLAWEATPIPSEFDDVTSMAWDARRQRMVATAMQYGGSSSTYVLYEVVGTEWHRVPLAPAVNMRVVANERRGSVMFLERSTDTVWERTDDTWTETEDRPFGSIYNAGYLSDTGELVVTMGVHGGLVIARRRYESPTPLEMCVPGEDRDGDGLVACDDPDCYWACAPRCPPETSCRF